MKGLENRKNGCKNRKDAFYVEEMKYHLEESLKKIPLNRCPTELPWLL